MQNNWKTQQYKRYFTSILTVYKSRPDLKIYLELILTIITVGVLAIFAIKPTLVTIAELFAKIQTLEETYTKLETKANNLNIAQRLYDEQETRINLLNDAVPKPDEVGKFLSEVEKLIAANNLTPINASLASVKLKSVQKPNDQEINLTISVSGNFDSLKNFTSQLAALRRPSIPTSITYSITQEADNKILSLTILTKLASKP